MMQEVPVQHVNSGAVRSFRVDRSGMGDTPASGLWLLVNGYGAEDAVHFRVEIPDLLSAIQAVQPGAFPEPAMAPAIPEDILSAARELVDATDAIRVLAAGRTASGPGARAFDAADALKALLTTQKPPVNPYDWETACPFGFSTVAFELACEYPDSLDDGCAIGLEIARKYTGPKLWAEASKAEKALGVRQVRMYPEDFLADAVAEAVTKPIF